MKTKHRPHPILTFFFCLALLAGFAPAALAEEIDTSPLADGAVAEVTINGTTSQYPTLKAAIDAVNHNGESPKIKLLADTSETVSLYIDSDIELDLNGHSISGYLYISFYQSSSFSVIDSETGGSLSDLYINSFGFGISSTLNICGGTVTHFFILNPNSTINIKDGTIEHLTNSGGTVNISDTGKVTNANNISGTININSGTVATATNNGGTIKITGGNVGLAINVSGDMTISGGAVTDAQNNGGTMNVTGGTITKTLWETDGTVNLTGSISIGTFQYSDGTLNYNASDLAINPTSLSLDTVSTISGQLTATITTTSFTFADGGAFSLPVSWKSSNTAVLTVSETGGTATVTAVGVGEATITASSGGIKASCTVTVKAGTLPAPSDLAWSITAPGQATWNTVEHASGYSVQLYKDNEPLGQPVSINDGSTTSHDFTDEMTQPGSYTFTVTTTGDNKNYLPSNPTIQSAALNYYAVTFNTNGGSTVAQQVVVNGGYATEPTPPTRANYTFAGWYSDSTFASAWDFDTPITEATTLYAKWTPNTYQVTLNTNGGTIHSGGVTEYTYGQGAALPTDVTRAGYTFGGWYDNEALTGEPVTAIGPAETGDKTFYAKWTENSSGGDSGEGSGGNTGEGPGSDTGSTGGSSGSSASGTSSGTSSSSGAAAQQATPYYTCPACGTHNWTATAEGYRCDNCGHIVTAQLSGYGNVKGSYDPATASGTAANAASAIPQTGDSSEPALWAVVCLLSAGALVALGATRRRRQ